MSGKTVHYDPICDDILIASTDHEVHQTELASLLDYLHKKGHKCSFHKAQVAKKQVTFLGQTIGAGNRSITQDRAGFSQSHTSA